MDAAKRAVKRRLVFDDHPKPSIKCLEQGQTLDDMGWEEIVESDSSDDRYLSGKPAKGEEKPPVLTQARTWKEVTGDSSGRSSGKPTASVGPKVMRTSVLVVSQLTSHRTLRLPTVGRTELSTAHRHPAQLCCRRTTRTTATSSSVTASLVR